MSIFTRRDLGNLLSDVAEGSGKVEKTDEFKPLKPLVDTSKKVIRYRRGQKPSWLKDEQAGSADARGGATAASGGPPRRASRFDASRRPPVAAAQVVADSSDSDDDGAARRRVAAAVIVDSSDSDEDGAGGGRRVAAAAAKAVPDSSDDEVVVANADLDDDAIAARRARLRARAAQSSSEEEEDSDDDGVVVVKPAAPHSRAGDAAAAAAPSGKAAAPGSDSDGSSSEYETDSSDDSDDGLGPVLLKPVFRRKEDRVTAKEAERRQAEEAEKERQRLAKLEERKAETMELVASEIKKEEDLLLAGEEEDDANKPDDTDDPATQDEEYEKWAVRELTRIKRDRDEREEKLRELAETERRRKLTPEELAAEDKLLEAQGLKVFRKEKRKLGFMQKYYHKGVFFMDEDSLKDANDVRNKTYDAPTGEDVYAKKDIDGLARVKQVKKFGLMGRTKWTHLSNEDTTSFDSPWMAKDNIRKQMSSRMAGVHGDLNSAGKLRRGTKRQRRS